MTLPRLLTLLVAAMLVSACGSSSDPDCRDAEALWSIDAEGVVCVETYVQALAPLDPPYTYHSCVWKDAYVVDSACGTVTAEFSLVDGAWGLDGYTVVSP